MTKFLLCLFIAAAAVAVAKDDAGEETVNLSWKFLVFIGGVLTAIATAAGAFLAKVLPAFGQWRKDYAAAEAEKKKSETAAAVASDQAAAAIKREMYDVVYHEFKDLLDRGEREMARRDGVIEAQDKRVDRLYDEIRHVQADKTDCLVKNEKLNAEIMLLQARLATIETAEGIMNVPTRVEGIVVIDSKGVIREWSPAATAMFNWRAKEAVGQSVENIVPADYLERHRAAFREVISSGRDVRRGPYRVEGLRRDGSRIPIELTLSGWEHDGERFFTAAIRLLLASELGPPVKPGELVASKASVLNIVREVVATTAPDIPAAGLPPGVEVRPTAEGVTLNVPAGGSAAVTVDSTKVDVKVSDKP